MRDLDLPGLRMRLLRGGVAPKHVNRMLDELRHHFTDLEQKALAEGLSQREAAARAVEQLGNPKLIIEAALARPELKSLAHRWPLGVYGIFPVVALVLVGTGATFVLASVLQLAESSSGLSPAAFGNILFDQWWARGLLDAWRLAIVYALPVVVAGMLCIYAAKRDAPILWPTVGVFLVLLLGLCHDFTISPPPAPDQPATFTVGIGFTAGYLLSVRVLRLLIPLILTLGPYFWWRQKQQKGFFA